MQPIISHRFPNCLTVWNLKGYPTLTMTEKLMTLSEVAQYVGRDRRTLYQMRKDGRFDVRPTPPHVRPARWLDTHIEAFKHGGSYPRVGD